MTRLSIPPFHFYWSGEINGGPGVGGYFGVHEWIYLRCSLGPKNEIYRDADASVSLYDAVHALLHPVCKYETTNAHGLDGTIRSKAVLVATGIVLLQVNFFELLLQPIIPVQPENTPEQPLQSCVHPQRSLLYLGCSDIDLGRREIVMYGSVPSDAFKNEGTVGE